MEESWLLTRKLPPCGPAFMVPEGDTQAAGVGVGGRHQQPYTAVNPVDYYNNWYDKRCQWAQ